jgi:hypothetical protein
VNGDHANYSERREAAMKYSAEVIQTMRDALEAVMASVPKTDSNEKLPTGETILFGSLSDIVVNSPELGLARAGPRAASLI